MRSGNRSGDSSYVTAYHTKSKPDAWCESSMGGVPRCELMSRPRWKPMHLQSVFKDCRARGGSVSERLFENGLCLPSGSALTEEELSRVCEVVRKAWPGQP